MDNIYLCGFMGSGKTTIGKLLAKKLSKRFLDLDTFIEKRTRCSINDIFKQYGEDDFRKIEASAFEEVCLMNGAVVAVGGGTFAYEHNIIAAKNSGRIIYLQMPFSTCYNRIKKSKSRPLVVIKSKDELQNTYHKRHTIYKISSSYIYEPRLTPEYCAKQLAQYYISTTNKQGAKN